MFRNPKDFNSTCSTSANDAAIEKKKQVVLLSKDVQLELALEVAMNQLKEMNQTTSTEDMDQLNHKPMKRPKIPAFPKGSIDISNLSSSSLT